MSEKGRRLLNLARVATLATINPDGSPHVIPIVFAIVGDRLVTAVDRKPKQDLNLARLRNIRSDPRVSVLAHHYAEGWHHLWWVRVDGHAKVVSEDPEAIAALKARYSQYNQYEITGPVITVAMERIRVWVADPRFQG
ncbi:MAG TPA: TIGR03668 family PPOX class F420-dependent oxidoreductase [Acidimicrobiia bacterium]|nr:TIGR03668 family PPOX class F420-dependent oxidoreductase [Acidimicrobiia bacterium]